MKQDNAIKKIPVLKAKGMKQNGNITTRSLNVVSFC